MPYSEFEQIEVSLMYSDKTLQRKQDVYDEGPYLVSSRQCSELYDKLQPLSLTIGLTKFTIQPQGYLYQIQDNEDQCFIGIQGIDNNINEYRLGQIFLRNFYVGLDYTSNEIQIGLIKEGSYASMEEQDPFDDDSAAPGKSGSGKKALVAIVILVMLGAIGGIVYLQV